MTSRTSLLWSISFVAASAVTFFAWRHWPEEELAVGATGVYRPPADDHGELPGSEKAGPAMGMGVVEVEDAEAVLGRDCPWPPHPDTWRDLDERCLAAMARMEPDAAAKLHRLVDDASATRRAVVAALDDPECRLPPLGSRDSDVPWNRWPRWQGEPRPDLRDRCAADAMVRLAELQVECVPPVTWDLARGYWDDRTSLERAAAEASLSQEEYYRLVRREELFHAFDFWRSFLCRSAEGALAWVDALPEPLGDPVDLTFARPPYTQALDLYDTARRLGADVPEWAEPSAYEDYDFDPSVKELPEGVYETGLPESPIRF